MIEGIIKGVLLLGDGILTGSELQCTNVLIDYFLYRNYICLFDYLFISS